MILAKNEELTIPMYSIWEMFLLSIFDVDLTSEKWIASLDPEVRELSIFIPKYSFWQMLRMAVFQTDE